MILAALILVVCLLLCTVGWLLIFIADDELDRALYGSQKASWLCRLAIALVLPSYWLVGLIVWLGDSRADFSWRRSAGLYADLATVLFFGKCAKVESEWE